MDWKFFSSRKKQFRLIVFGFHVGIKSKLCKWQPTIRWMSYCYVIMSKKNIEINNNNIT